MPDLRRPAGAGPGGCPDDGAGSRAGRRRDALRVPAAGRVRAAVTRSVGSGDAVLVAVDGSAASSAAVSVAAAWAGRRRVGLTIVHVVEAPLIHRAHGPDPLPPAVDAARAVQPALDV